MKVRESERERESARESERESTRERDRGECMGGGGAEREGYSLAPARTLLLTLALSHTHTLAHFL